ncbi:hypothetical protein EsDP_00001874 [Epichloe bromicola]|uniref:Uncharacterized protein n=1 Tax=Epichloe bromicola TaxID=79588 RepID=A0ABQ0CJ60_9HYPO
MPSRRLDGKVAIATGTASRFGRGISEKPSQEGAKAIVAGLSQEVGKSTASALGGGLFVEADVTKASCKGSSCRRNARAASSKEPPRLAYGPVGSTGMAHLFLGKPDTLEDRTAVVSTVPLGRPSTPADVANTYCYLASEEEKAGFITGVNIEVDGGRCV